MPHREERRLIARRVLRTSANEPVRAVLYQPVLVKRGEWRCDFTITGLEDEIRDAARGEDSLEVLILAIQGLRFYLERSGEPLRWADGPVGELGLPRPIPDSYGIDVEKHLTKLVNDEVGRLAKARIHRRKAPRASARRDQRKR